jgi:hypothetical protein
MVHHINDASGDLRMNYRLLVVVCIVLFMSGNVFAQDNPPALWPVVERCLPTPTVPDKGWTFDGEILMTGWGGIHGVRASQNTPYIVHWHDAYAPISPDGQWILTQHLHVETEQLTGPGPMGRYHFYYGDIAAENLTTGQKITFDWEAYISFSSRPYLADHAEPFWLDNHHFAAFWGTYGRETKIGNLDSGDITDWPDFELEDAELSISPDQTRVVNYGKLYKLPDNTPITDADVATNYDFTVTAWTADSSMLADKIWHQDEEMSHLTIFDRDGKLVATPFIGRVDDVGAWSPDNHYFTFSAQPDPKVYKSHTFMLDIQKQVVYDLCEGLRGLAWSPDGTQFATIAGEGQQPVMVADVDDWKAFIVAYHTGAVRFWRSLQ